MIDSEYFEKSHSLRALTGGGYVTDIMQLCINKFDSATFRCGRSKGPELNHLRSVHILNNDSKYFVKSFRLKALKTLQICY